MTLGGQHARHFWLPLVLVGLLAAVTAWLGQLAQRPGAPNVGPAGHVQDFFVEDLTATAYDVDGAPRYRLAAVKLTHFMDDNSAELEAPRFERLGDDRAHVLVRSLRGRVSGDGEHVHFLGDVRMLRARGPGQPPLEVSTEALHVQPDREMIETDQPVVLRDGRGELRGAGLVADGKLRTLAMQGRVRGTYENRH
ncbi:MAG: LPS export ABC transporter periplasmic protein LptC [Pseudomonadota bacterium]